MNRISNGELTSSAHSWSTQPGNSSGPFVFLVSSASWTSSPLTHLFPTTHISLQEYMLSLCTVNWDGKIIVKTHVFIFLVITILSFITMFCILFRFSFAIDVLDEKLSFLFLFFIYYVSQNSSVRLLLFWYSHYKVICIFCTLRTIVSFSSFCFPKFLVKPPFPFLFLPVTCIYSFIPFFFNTTKMSTPCIHISILFIGLKFNFSKNVLSP